MKRSILFLGIVFAIGFCSCSTGSGSKTLLYRAFPTMSWERFDFIKENIEIKKATTYDLALAVSFDSTYVYDDLSVVFTVFDSYDNPLRTKAYQFRLKEKDGSWKSTFVDGCYRFTFPINSELTINEPGVYCFQLESRMPITPLYGIKEISVIRNN